ncbi:hypothetical protein HIM_07266 [Hirsutella minnesotensis 3608]|uniref:Uncharacterized protein n=1 Tax=Hirsutella minnesotensis 3608 TaxID=1043627 RepID=A0A0F7ZYY1_9HYPO|nr:hypothetical protein HIM_07266 [Hirsutella minnesotensis 3608]
MGHVDPKQPPHRSKPWTAISSREFIHKVDLIAPQECYSILQKLLEQRQRPVYARVTMTLGQWLQEDILADCVKKGDTWIMSEGCRTTHNTFEIRQGILEMYLDKATYERAGLPGKPYGPKGNRGCKPRWIVTHDLTSPSMVRGKRGFDRLLYACENVFGNPLNWLVCNAVMTATSLALEKYSPVQHNVEPNILENRVVSQVELAIPNPILAQGDRAGLEESATGLYEWLSLIRLQSPRANFGDDIDPFLSRYRNPGEKGEKSHVVTMSWQGFFSAPWVRHLLVDILEACSPQIWFSISVTSFARNIPGNSSDLTLLKPSGSSGEYLMWEVRSLD